VSCSDAASALTSELTASLYTTVLMDGSFKDFHRSNQGHGCPQAGAMGHLSPGNVVECFCVLAVNSKTLNCLNQSINQSLFQAEAHGTHSKENANTGNRTEQTQTHRRIHVKTRTKNHSLQNTQRESLQTDYEHAKSLTKRTSLLEHTLKRCKNIQLALCITVLILGTLSCNNISVTL